jgi:moderate conductance mechanosensitive channel
MFRYVFGASVDWFSLIPALAGTLVAAYVVAEIAARFARTTLLFLSQSPDLAVQRPTRIVRAIMFGLLVAVLFRPALNLAGLRPAIGVDGRTLSAWLFDSGLRIVLLVVVMYLLVRAVGVLTGRFEHTLRHEAISAIDTLERIKRARTLAQLVQRLLTIVIVSIGGIMILRELRVDITPILTGAGILGLAVGFGAQTLVRDIISGFFVILENQVRVGDAAVINGTSGLVEAINLRTIVLRDFEGVVHIFPNGAVTTLANRTKDYSYAVVDVGTAYNEDPDVVIALLRNLGRELAADPAYHHSVLEPLEVVGVESLGDTHMTIRTRIKTLPLKQWEIAREFRRRIKKAFDTHGIRFRGTQLLTDAGAVKPPPLTG